ncbi:MAG: ABC transporter substrate-binding protein [Haloarculaceae archaeon]
MTPGGPTGLSVGYLMPFSGRFASVGNAARKGAELAAAEASAAENVEVTFADTAGDPDRGVEEATALVETGVDALVGFASSAVGLAVAEACRPDDAVLVMTAAQSPEIERSNPSAFRVMSDLGALNAATARVVARETGGRRVAGVLPDYRFGRETWRAFTDELRAVAPSADVVSEVYLPDDPETYERAIEETLAADPDVVYTSLWSGELVDYVERAEPAGLFDATQVVFGSAVVSDVLPALERVGVEGIASTHYHHTHPETPANEAFVSAFRERFGEPPADVAQEAYAGVRALCAAADRAGGTGPRALARGLEGLTFEAPEGEKHVRASDHGVTEERLWVGRLGWGEDGYGFTEMWTVPGSAVSPER